MANPGDVILKHLSGSTDGIPIKISGTAATAPTDVHTSLSGTEEIDRVTLIACNTDTLPIVVGVVVYASSPTDPDNVVVKLEIPPNSGGIVLLDGAAVGNSKKVGVYAGTANKVMAWGWVARNTVAQ